MTDLDPPIECSLYNDRSLQKLVRAIALSEGNFSLILVRCNYVTLQRGMVQRLESLCQEISQEGRSVHSMVLPKTVTTLYSTLVDSLDQQQPLAVMIFGLDCTKGLEQLLVSANQVRDEFRNSFPFPLIWWVTEEVLASLIRFAPDFKSWAATSIKFEMETPSLLDLLHQEAGSLIPHLLEQGANASGYEWCIPSPLKSNRRKELESAVKDLQNRGVTLDPELSASVQFVLGRDEFCRDRLDLAEAHYHESLTLWQHIGPGSPLSDSEPQAPEITPLTVSSPDLERLGLLWFHLGLLYCRKAELYQAQSQQHLMEAESYLDRALTLFESGGRLDCVAQLSPLLGEVLARLQRWDRLQVQVEKTLDLHEKHPVQLARDYGFMAEVALAREEWEQSKEYAQKAIAALALAPVPERQEQGLYLYLLARATVPELSPLEATQAPSKFKDSAPSWYQQSQSAIEILNLAQQVSKPERDPQLYISILKLLRSLYFEHREYVEAFRLKQEQRSIETLYGFRAFVGAGLLQPQTKAHPQPLNQTALSGLAPKYSEFLGLPQEIAAAGRQQHIECLLERMTRADKKLTILYGDSGVGKSSLVNAGFVPALAGRAIGDRLALPVVLRSYTDWIATLSKRLNETISQTLGISLDPNPEWTELEGTLELSEPVTEQNSPDPSPGEAALSMLRSNVNRNLLTVIVFDQFEEFFFVHKTQESRQEFYRFLQICLDIPFVKVILSLRTDFLHYLLDCERLCYLDAINNDILSKEIRYQLSDFSAAQAVEVIQRLTERSQFYLETELIEALVRDLANETGQVRPIELQLVGAQLQDDEEKITTLEQYQTLGDRPKEILIARSLVQVIRDCGPDNEKPAWEVLYRLTNQNNTRPLRTQDELAASGEVTPSQLDLILKILEGAGLVFIHREESGDRYQLVHDYLVHPVRQKYESDFGPEARLVKAEEAKKMTQVQLEKSNKKLKRQRGFLGFLAGLLAFASVFAVAQKEQASIGVENAQITAISASSEALYVSDREFDALVESLRAWRKLSSAKSPDSETKLRVATALQQAVYGVRERNRLEEHGAEVWSVAFSPDGQLLASGSNDTQVLLWNRNGSLHKKLVDYSLDVTGVSHADAVTSVAFSNDGNLIASASKDRTVKLWKRDGSLYKTLTGHTDSIYSASFSPDSQFVATASHDQTVMLWRVSDGTLVRRFQGHTDSVNWVTFSPDGQTLASASDDKTVKLWSLDGALQKTLRVHTDWVTALAFSPDGRHLVSAGVDHTISVTNLEENRTQTWKAHDDIVFSLSFSPDGRWFASAGDDNAIKIWKLDGTAIKTLKGHSGRVTSVNFSPDGMTLASASWDKTIRLWTLKDTFLKVLAGEVGHKGRVSSISLSPTGKQLASASWDKTVKIWSLDPGRTKDAVTTLQGSDGHDARVFGVSFSHDGRAIASVSQDCTVKIWNATNGTLLKTLVDPNLTGDSSKHSDCPVESSHSDRAYSVSFSPDGQLIASGSRDKTVKIWRIDGTLLKVLEGHTERVNSVAFSPDGRLIVSGSDDKMVKLWNKEGELLQTLSGRYPHQSYVTSVTFSPDGQRVASASWDNTVKIWHLDGTLEKTLLQGYSDSVESVRFSPDGRLLVSASWDGTVKLWSLKDGTLLKTLQGHTSGVLDVEFSPDGEIIASAGDDNTVILWNLDLDDLTRRACTWLHDYFKYSKNISEGDRALCEEAIKEQRFPKSRVPDLQRLTRSR
ncbi:WD40 repeat domain-containing protein [Laspinema sp. A4]|uniref:WD40 repeat domain-containing protein n=1 Tax=Laspinema sp. D2d TaxID=2953686 RepID=UPI0021BB454A|nr:WD40 repeat domain-containing protein [Laspinema sp. D2d]MCT7983667.1 WD40 repeat domain-containing protein [Laspinema sp. D2d]